MNFYPLFLWFFMGCVYLSMCYLAFRLNKALSVIRSPFGVVALRAAVGFLCLHILVLIIILILGPLHLTDSTVATLIVSYDIFSTSLKVSQLMLGVTILFFLLKFIPVIKSSS